MVPTEGFGDSDTFVAPKSFFLVCKQSHGCSHSLPLEKEEWLRRMKRDADGGHITLADLMASHWP